MAKVLSNLRITQHYGNNGHTGVDLGATSDRKVFANADGTVEQIQTGIPNDKGSSGMRSYGNMILIKHPNGMKTRYAHLQTVLVSKGQSVKAGQQIGVQGNTGNSYGVHLHYEVYNSNGTRTNPEPYIEKPVYQSSTPVGYTGDIIYQSYDNVRKAWCPEVKNDKDDAGNLGHPLGGFRAKADKATIYMQAHVKGGEWLSTINSSTYSRNSNNGNSYSGWIGKEIDGIKVWASQGYVSYRVHIKGGNWLPWVNKADNTPQGYAGIYGQAIDLLQMK
jgi:hypothetical protein